jgi:hypothetical protein
MKELVATNRMGQIPRERGAQKKAAGGNVNPAALEQTSPRYERDSEA